MTYICECLGQGGGRGAAPEEGIALICFGALKPLADPRHLWKQSRCLLRLGQTHLTFCFSYAGHGAGARFLDGQAVLRLSCRAVALLFGCSSAALAVHGNLEGAGIVLKYIMAGW